MKKMRGGAETLPFFSKLYTDTSLRKCLVKYAFMTLLFIVVCIIILRIISSPESSSYNVQKYFFFYAIPLVILFALMLNVGSGANTLSLLLKLSGLFAVIGGLVYLYSQTSAPMFDIGGYSKNILLGLIIILGLGILYNVFIKYLTQLSNLNTWAGFFAQLVFYIPCMLYDFIVYCINDYSTAPFSVHIVLFLEVVFIMFYLYLPNISNAVTGLHNGKQLLSNVYFLNQGINTIATSEDLRVNTTTPSNGVNTYRVNYALSMWVYTNPQNPSSLAYSQESEILTYGYVDGSGVQHVKPMLRYYCGGNETDLPVERNKYVFYFSKYPPTAQYETSEHTFYDVTLPNQRWNQIILNYRGNDVDLYINGDLERTFEMKNALPQYSDLDTISVGSSNGLDGAICNVAYYDFPLTKDQVVFSYNTFVGMNPPVPRNTQKTPWENTLMKIAFF